MCVNGRQKDVLWPCLKKLGRRLTASNESGRFFAFGRVFSGKVSPSMKTQVTLLDVPCGNTVALVGLDQFVTKNAILTNVEEVKGADE
ncbi:elongation factor 2 [Tanacetum coccineum]